MQQGDVAAVRGKSAMGDAVACAKRRFFDVSGRSENQIPRGCSIWPAVRAPRRPVAHVRKRLGHAKFNQQYSMSLSYQPDRDNDTITRVTIQTVLRHRFIYSALVSLPYSDDANAGAALRTLCQRRPAPHRHLVGGPLPRRANRQRQLLLTCCRYIELNPVRAR